MQTAVMSEEPAAPSEAATPLSGKIKFYNFRRSYGFILFGTPERELFFHKSSVRTRYDLGRPYLRKMQGVLFTIKAGLKGEEADNILDASGSPIGNFVERFSRGFQERIGGGFAAEADQSSELQSLDAASNQAISPSSSASSPPSHALPSAVVASNSILLAPSTLSSPPRREAGGGMGAPGHRYLSQRPYPSPRGGFNDGYSSGYYHRGGFDRGRGGRGGVSAGDGYRGRGRGRGRGGFQRGGYNDGFSGGYYRGGDHGWHRVGGGERGSGSYRGNWLRGGGERGRGAGGGYFRGGSNDGSNNGYGGGVGWPRGGGGYSRGGYGGGGGWSRGRDGFWRPPSESAVVREEESAVSHHAPDEGG